MRPSKAIRACFTKSFKFSGRATRSEFWWFFPIGTTAAMVMAWKILPMFTAVNFAVTCVIAFFLLTPVWAAGSRRLQDTGEDGQNIFVLAQIFFGLPIGFALCMYLVAIVSAGTALLLIIILVIPATVCWFLAVFTVLGPTIGQLILPSDPSTNRYGTYPNDDSV